MIAAIHRLAVVMTLAMLAYLAPAFALAQAPRSAAPDFVWRVDHSVPDFQAVRFANGDTARVEANDVPGVTFKGNCGNGRLQIRDAKTGARREIAPACHDVVSVLAVYPSAHQAQVAIVAAHCGVGSCASYEEYAVVYLDQGRVRTVNVGFGARGHRGKPTTFSFWFRGGRLVKSVIANFHDGRKNEWGDLLPSARFLHESGHYVDTRFRKAFLKLVGDHPEALLSDPVLRAVITRQVTPEQFRAIRSALGGPGSSTMKWGRYLVMDGCMTSACPDQFGSIVIDGLTGHLQVMVFVPDEKRWIHVGTRPLVPIDDNTWLNEVQTQDVIRLSIAQGGTLKVEPVTAK